MIRESFPDSVDFQTPSTRPEFQGGVNSCTAFGITSALEAMAHRAGEIVQLSPRFVWYFLDKSNLTIENAVATVNRVGICDDSLCPYLIDQLDVAPSFDAVMWAYKRMTLKTKTIAGKEEVMRALATGHTCIIKRINPANAGGNNHVEALIGYDKTKGVKVHGSYSDITWQPWDVLGTAITQIDQIVDCPWPAVPHPDYVEGDLPVLDGNILTIPLLDVTQNFPAPWLHFQGVILEFQDFGKVDVDSGNITFQALPYWHANRGFLALPVVMFQGKRYERISLTNPAVKVNAYEVRA